MKNRIKISLPQLVTRDDAEAAMNELALAVNNQRRLITQRDALVLKVNNQFESPLGELDADIKAKTDTLRAWAEAHPEEFPKNRKSLDLSAGVLGFRTGTPKLTLLSRAFTWDKVLALLSASATWAGFIRTKQEVDKEVILGAYSQAADQRAFDEDIRALGLKVTQDESFFVEPRLTDLDARQQEAK